MPEVKPVDSPGKCVILWIGKRLWQFLAAALPLGFVIRSYRVIVVSCRKQEYCPRCGRKGGCDAQS